MAMHFTDKPLNSTRGSAVVFNTEAAYYFLTDDRYRRQVEQADWLYCDGSGLTMYLRYRFGRSIARCHGPDIFAEYLADTRGLKIVLLGGSPEAHAGLRVRYPDFFHGNQVQVDTRFFAPASYQAIAKEIAGKGVDDVLIFLGLRRQEEFQNHLHGAGFMGRSIGLGAAIDFLSGTKPRAGRMYQKLGLEWLPRMIGEPRMVPRVLRSFALFALFACPANRQLGLAATSSKDICS
jgi:N-acetylglucosaminyldiphosphoundecaprenol N-acetyl-beta-D-mannosaminyltransferase